MTFFCCCQKYFFPGDGEPVIELDGLNICSWLMGLVFLLMTTVWHRRTNFQVRQDHPKTLRTSLYLQLLLQSIYLVPLFQAPFDQNDWFDP